MLDYYFTYPAVLRRMRRGPLGGEIDAMAGALRRAGYRRASARRYLSLLASVSRYAERCRYSTIDAVDRRLIMRFVRRRAWSPSTARVIRSAIGFAARHLDVRPSVAPLSASAQRDAVLLARFDGYLRNVRGLEAKSREELLRAAGRTLVWYRQTKPRHTLRHLSARDVLAYAVSTTHRRAAHRTRSATLSHLRNFLRYLHWSGVCRVNLSRHVPRVPIWPLADLPTYLPWAEVRRLLDALPGADPIGKRDRALLVLVATTGMRNGELRRLERGDIHWRTGEVHLRRTKSRRDRVVPLLPEAGRALSDYLVHGRPRTADPHVFLSHRPPIEPFRISSTVSAIVRRRLAELNIRPARAGTHILRHSLATQMVQQARPVQEVADLLGHQRLDTTAVYIKVALPQLATVALPFPGGAA